MRAVFALHLAPLAVLGLLALWFGQVDHRVVGERGRCGSCGVEGYVLALHAVAALALGAVVLACSRMREAHAGRGARPGRRTAICLGAAGAYLLASLVHHELFDLYGFVMLVVSPVAALAALVWWAVDLLRLRRAAPAADRPELLTSMLARAWLSLIVLLPGLFAWVWADRVQWFVF